MKILVTGYTGQLGFDVVREGLIRGFDMNGIGSKDLDIINEQEVYSFVNRMRPDAIIHCGAYTAVDRAEEDRRTCWNVNVEGTKYLALAAKNVRAKFMYMSTDYVFDGKSETPYKESDMPTPINYYGLTKYEGEKVVESLLTNYFIVRISWVFGMNGNNFVKNMLRLSESHDEINVVGDQFGSPTYTCDLARLLIDMIQGDKFGLYHVTNEGYCSWAEFASEIYRLSNKTVKVNAISTEQYPTRAARPKNSRLSKQLLVDNGFKLLPRWQDALKQFISELSQEVK
ncbi:dTDP-4-dehydrorhamnose reductase [Paenibacillus solanacearum]|uniref:dTDP-4-dehydrorhamnose reductase n=1 Tax=Paenibacillus solanacearum TaxID=2048548 RepID=A0A916JZM7_9BACL|nr:dTDP-4-dehydrorhamnose reductase [Paenibacillus solanacearum]CAG7613315.1 dTDP-4-dehydrorhamnose reductase [Paenibacillus solanacearum]